MGRFLAIDYGDRRIGLAVSDATETLASPLRLLKRTEVGEDFRVLVQVIDDEQIVALVVGAPLNDDGTKGAMVIRIEAFIDQLLTQRALPVFWVDEAFTSIEAEEILRRSVKDWRVRRERIDVLAAQLILQSFLNQRAMDRQRAARQQELTVEDPDQFTSEEPLEST